MNECQHARLIRDVGTSHLRVSGMSEGSWFEHLLECDGSYI